MNLRRKAIVLGLALPLPLLALFIALRRNPDRSQLQSPERRQWKQKAIEQVNTISRNTDLLEAEIDSVKKEIALKEEDGWIGTNVVLMTNGEYLVYSQVDAKEKAGIRDLLIGRGSNNKWYYSTYHFCIHMISLRVDEQPGSISDFTNRYAVLEFDGKSDECLKRTWPTKKR